MSKLVRGMGGDNQMQLRLSAYVLATRLDQVVAAIGHERLVFGSDMYARPKMWNYPAGLMEVCTSEELDADQREAILYGNAARLFSLPA